MNTEVMEKQLYDASVKGDVEKLEALMREDELILARVSVSSCFKQTPLHVASMLGHFEFAKSILSYKPDFASRLDSQGRSPLHLASANGYANIVERLLQCDPKMCRVSDEDGRTPLHMAVMNGQHEAVSELIKFKSESRDQELGRALHLCVVYSRLDVLIQILESTGQELADTKDDNGNTLLHLATSLRRTQIVKYLMTSRSEVIANAVYQNGLTALDIIEKMPDDEKTPEIKELLTSRDEENNEAKTTSSVLIESAGSYESNRKLGKIWHKAKNFTIFHAEKKKREEPLLIVAASLIAAMAYQAALSPPGGLAGTDATEISSSSSLRDKRYDLKPGHSLLAYFNPALSNVFWISNTISFVAALTVFFLLASGLPLKRRLLFWLLRTAVSITLSSITIAYSCAVLATTPLNRTYYAVVIGLYFWPFYYWVVYRSISYVFGSIRMVVRIFKKKKARTMNISQVSRSSITQYIV